MISLEKYNQLIDHKRKDKHQTGIVCPSCELGELLFKNPGEYYMSNPMQADTECSHCHTVKRIRVVY